MATASQTSVVGPAQVVTSSLAVACGPLPSPNGHPTVRPPITKAIDIWALGVTLYCFVFGRCPFIADTEFELFNIIPRKPLSFPDSVPGRETIEDGLKDLLSRLLEKDVFKRITLKEVKVQHLTYHAILVSWICHNNSPKCHAYKIILNRSIHGSLRTLLTRFDGGLRQILCTIKGYMSPRTKCRVPSRSWIESKTAFANCLSH